MLEAGQCFYFLRILSVLNDVRENNIILTSCVWEKTWEFTYWLHC